MGADPSDGELLRAVATGDAQALAALYDRHAGWLHARLTRRCQDPETVREVLQDTFVTAWRTAGAHRGGEAGG
ncbi:RNA polymerase sigma factor, partial [Streptomyces sparsogenes]